MNLTYVSPFDGPPFFWLSGPVFPARLSQDFLAPRLRLHSVRKVFLFPIIQRLFFFRHTNSQPITITHHTSLLISFSFHLGAALYTSPHFLEGECSVLFEWRLSSVIFTFDHSSFLQSLLSNPLLVVFRCHFSPPRTFSPLVKSSFPWLSSHHSGSRLPLLFLGFPSFFTAPRPRA